MIDLLLSQQFLILDAFCDDYNVKHALFVYREEIFVMLSLVKPFKNSWNKWCCIDDK